MGFSRTGISCILILHHLAMFYVKCQAPVNLKAVFDIKTGNINVTWEDPFGGVPRNGYLFTYNAPSISRKDITGLRQMHYEIRPPVLGEIYKISVYAERSTGRSPAAETSIASPKSEYKNRGSTVSITLTGISNEILEVRHDMKLLFAIVGGSSIQNTEPGKAKATLSPDNTQVVLTIENVDVQDAGVYMLKSRNNPETIDSVLLVITVKPSTPTITITPSTAVVSLPVTLNCQSQSNSVPEYHNLKLTYSWRINDTDITPRLRPIYTINKNNLTKSRLAIRNKYDIYVCIATETNGLTSDPGSMRLQLIYGPQTVTLNPSTTSIIVEEGKPIAPIRCEADCNPACTLRWITSDNRQSIMGGILNLGAAGRNEDATYTCVAAAESPVPLNLRSLRSDAVRVDVQYKAAITEVSHSINGKNKGPISDGQEIEINESDNLALRCNVDADPLAVVKFLDKENNIFSTKTISSLSTELIQMRCEQTGKYLCQASNKYNSEPASQALHVKVRCSPRELSDVPKVFGGKRNTKILFTTAIIAYPTPTATWKSSVSDDTVVNINDYTFNVSASVAISGEESYGSYNVTISNGVQSNLILSFIVRSEDRPDTPRNFTAVNFDYNFVNLTWISPFNGGSTQTFNIEQKQENAVNSYQNIIADVEDVGQNRLMFYVVENLKPKTSYEFRLYSKNSIGQSDDIRITIVTPGLYVRSTAKVIYGREKLRKKEKPASPIIEGLEDPIQPGVIAGVVIGIVVVIGLIAIILFMVKRKTAKGDTPRDVSADQKTGVNDEVLYAVPQKPKANKQRVENNEIIYENSLKSEQEVAQPTSNDVPASTPSRKVNEDGLIYIDVEIKPNPNSAKKGHIIHGAEDRTNYTMIDFTKKAEPLPNVENESEYENK